MADLADVEEALKAVITTALYPSGVPAGNVSPVCGKPARIYRGWPINKNLDADLTAGIVNVSIFAEPNVTQLDSRYPRKWQRKGAAIMPTLAWSIAGNVATLVGPVTAGENVALIVDGQDVVFTAAEDDTPASIVDALALLLIPFGVWQVSNAGPALAIGGAHSIIGRVGVSQPIIRELRRQRQNIRVTVWCADPSTRDAAASAVDSALAPLNFLAMPDGFGARIRYHGVAVNDGAENADLFRRDMVYTVEYATTQAGTAPTVTVIRKTLQGAQQDPASMAEGDPPTIGGVFAVQLDGDGNPILDGSGNYVIGGNAGPLLTKMETDNGN